MRSIPWSVRKRFYERAATQVQNGRPLSAVLEEFRGQLEQRGRKKLAGEWRAVAARMRDGRTLAEAFGKKIPRMEYGMLDTGEKSGSLPDAMRMIVTVEERIGRVRNKLLASFTSPAVYFATLYGTLLIIALKVVPVFAVVIPPQKWEGWASVMYVMAEMTVSFMGLAVALLVAVAIALAVWSLPRWNGKLRTNLDGWLFPYSIYRDIAGYDWLMRFAALLASGVPDTAILEDQIRGASPWLRHRLVAIHNGIRNGLDLGSAMRRAGTRFPSQDLIDEIAAYAAFKDFDKKIVLVADQYAEQLERRLTMLSVGLGLVFTFLMFMAFVVVQLGSNDISSQLSNTIGRF